MPVESSWQRIQALEFIPEDITFCEQVVDESIKIIFVKKHNYDADILTSW
jgi:hypothetical protein